jgi:hypothetical protein
VVLLGDADLLDSVKQIESQGIVPSLTAVCPECGKMTAILCDNRAPLVHFIALWQRLGPYLV